MTLSLKEQMMAMEGESEDLEIKKNVPLHTLTTDFLLKFQSVLISLLAKA